MKMNFGIGGFKSKSCVAIALSLLFGGIPLMCEAAPVFHSPVGPAWDFVSGGGGQQGLALLTFSNNNTFAGYVLVAGSRASVNATERSSGGDAGRGGGSGSSSDTNASTTLFGFTSVSGPWFFDTKGRVVGYFTELVNVLTVITNYGPMHVNTNIDVFDDGTFTTNLAFVFSSRVFLTNITWTSPSNLVRQFTFVNTNITIAPGTAEQTNAISFVGKVVPGKRFTIVSSTSYGKVTYKGVPSMLITNLPAAGGTDFDGSFWYGIKTANKQKFNEFFSLSGTTVPNIYSVDGTGPGYSYSDGTCMISKQKKIGFTFVESGNLRASVGSFSNTKKAASAKTKGLEDPDLPITFNATLLPAP
jgi:hypothetical protein